MEQRRQVLPFAEEFFFVAPCGFKGNLLLFLPGGLSKWKNTEFQTRVPNRTVRVPFGDLHLVPFCRGEDSTRKMECGSSPPSQGRGDGCIGHRGLSQKGRSPKWWVCSVPFQANKEGILPKKTHPLIGTNHYIGCNRGIQPPK